MSTLTKTSMRTSTASVLHTKACNALPGFAGLEGIPGGSFRGSTPVILKTVPTGNLFDLFCAQHYKPRREPNITVAILDSGVPDDHPLLNLLNVRLAGQLMAYCVCNDDDTSQVTDDETWDTVLAHVGILPNVEDIPVAKFYEPASYNWNADDFQVEQAVSEFSK